MRRDLIRLVREKKADQKSLDRLDELGEELELLRLAPGVLRRAAELWADVRVRHLPFAQDASLDADVILAAQALSVGGTVVTFNKKHLGALVSARRWDEIGL